MTHGRGIAVSFIVALAALPSSAAAADSRLGASQPLSDKLVPGEVIVQYRTGASSSDRAQARSLVAATVKRSLLLPRTELVSVRTGDERAAAAQLNRDRNVIYAEPNGILHAQATPNDTRFGELWGLHNTGQVVNGFTGLADADIDAPEGWNMGAGLTSTVRVAVIDSGVARSHPDLAPNMFTNPGESGGGKETNGIDDDANGRIDDFRGWDFINNDNNPEDDNLHGTHVAGTIAARTNNALGISGVAAFPPTTGIWGGPKIVAIKVLNAAGSGSFAAIADGFVYAGRIGAKIGNASLGGAGTSTTLDNAIKASPATLFAVAAGNDGVNNDTSPHTPCNPATTPDAANKICVAATDSRDELADFSNFGVTNVDLAGPGVSVLSTTPTPMTLFTDNFETSITGRWTTNDAGQTGTPRWARSTLFSTSPTNSITDSPGGTASAPTPYANNQDNWARNTTGLNLTGLTGCKIRVEASVDTEFDFDFFTIEASRTPTVAASWQTIFSFSGSGQGFAEGNLPAAFDNRTGVFVRLRLTSDESVQGDGAYIDDVRVSCFRTSASPAAYDFLNGTSMATPHVAGAATFLATKFPTASVATLKDKILRSVDKKTALNGQVATGGRLNLYKAAAESTASVSGGVLRWTAGPGQKNTVTVTRFTDTDGVAKYRISDLYSTSTTTTQSGSRMIPGAGCQRSTETAVKCPAAGVTGIILRSGDLDDTLNASTVPLRLSMYGEAGADILIGGTAGDALIGSTGADRFTGGTGNDTISARSEDVDALFSCGENTGDSDTVNADLSPNDPVTASATNCEVVNKL